MRIPGLKALKTLYRWTRARMQGGALILGYHRVAYTTQNAYDLCVSPRHFAEHLQVLKTYARPVRLGELAQIRAPKSVVLTFDDGYLDNLQQAKPLLEAFQLPATFFVCSGLLGQEFWWEELARLILAPGTVLPPLHLNLGEKWFVWDKPGVAKTTQRKLLQTLYKRLLTMTPEQRHYALEQIHTWRGDESRLPSRTASRALIADELHELASSKWVEIGSHTVSHPILTTLSDAEQAREIQQSKRHLETLLQHPVMGFSFPNGSFSMQTQDLVRQAGYAYACMSSPDVVLKNSDSFALPRFWVGDWDGARFAAWLKRWL